MQLIFFAERAKLSSMRRAVAVRLAREHSVVIVAEPVSVVRAPGTIPRFRRIVGRPAPGTAAELQPLHLPVRLPIIGCQFERLNHALLTRDLSALADPYRDGERVVLYDSPSQHHLVGRLGEVRSVYLAIDDRTVTVTGEEIAGEKEAERHLLESVDQVICVSQPLADTLRARVPDRSSIPIDVVSNGYDDELFVPDAAFSEPAVLAQVPRPRVLVAGHVSERIDWDGITAFAALRPDVAWVFLGPADLRMTERVQVIRADMRILAPVPHSEVPAFIAHTDVCAAPYCLNAFTRASSPLKVIEYLGMGAPVVTTRVDALEVFHNVVYPVAEGDGHSYAAAMARALADGRSASRRAARVAAVAAHTWSRKAAEVYRIICGAR